MSSSPKKRPTTGWNPSVLAAVAWAVWMAACGAASPPGSDPRGTVRFACAVEQAQLIVDETRLGPIGAFHTRGILLRPGVHRVVVTAPGYFTEYIEIFVRADEVQTVEVTLVPVP